MSVKYAELDGMGKIALYKRRGNKNIRLSVSPGGEIRVSIPYWLPYQAGIKFAQSKKDWLKAQQTNRSSLFRSGQAIGKSHHLSFIEADLTRVSAKVTDIEVIIKYPPSLGYSSGSVQSAAKKAAIKALTNESKALLPQRLHTLAASHGFYYTDLRFRQLKSRWGSCDTNSRITLNIFLMQLPWELIDYVLLHELVHTKVFRHGPDFWKTLEHYSPGSKQLRKQLKNYRAAFNS